MTSFARLTTSISLANTVERLMPIAETGLVFPFTLAPLEQDVGCELRLGLASDTTGEADELARRIADTIRSA